MLSYQPIIGTCATFLELQDIMHKALLYTGRGVAKYLISVILVLACDDRQLFFNMS
jgi:hypothetical protein